MEPYKRACVPMEYKGVTYDLACPVERELLREARKTFTQRHSIDIIFYCCIFIGILQIIKIILEAMGGTS